jgi:hypothetical protein
MDNKQILGALAMDLKRVALALYRKSHHTADRFLIEAMNRKAEINPDELQPYMKKIINSVGALNTLTLEQRAEETLMYSTRIQNYVLYK